MPSDASADRAPGPDERRLGPGGPLVSRMGLGLAALGRPAYITGGRAGDLPDRSVAGLRARTFAVLDAAYAAGIRYADAARSYGRAEEFLAGWLAARIAIMVQACDATAGLIGTALHLLQDRPAGGDGLAADDGSAGSADVRADADWPTAAVLDETLRRRPPASKIRRVASASADVGGQRVGAGERVVCDIDAAGRDPQGAPHGTGQAAPPGLAFGAGLRPCPGPGQALALAAGVIDAVRALRASARGTGHLRGGAHPGPGTAGSDSPVARLRPDERLCRDPRRPRGEPDPVSPIHLISCPAWWHRVGDVMIVTDLPQNSAYYRSRS